MQTTVQARLWTEKRDLRFQNVEGKRVRDVRAIYGSAAAGSAVGEAFLSLSCER